MVTDRQREELWERVTVDADAAAAAVVAAVAAVAAVPAAVAAVLVLVLVMHVVAVAAVNAVIKIPRFILLQYLMSMLAITVNKGRFKL